jgi:hypothetical protein
MSALCPYCGCPTLDDGMCAYHAVGPGGPDVDNWANSNRIMCDFIHRGIVLEGASTELPGSAIDLEDPVLV